jgi:hypothetical protein
MKTFLTLVVFSFVAVTAAGQNEAAKSTATDTSKVQIVEAACGECQFGLKGKSCDLAVRIDGHAYFVDGSSIDSHGDAHAKDGFCKAVRKAEVKGEIVNNRFKVTYFKLLKTPETPVKHVKSKQGS